MITHVVDSNTSANALSVDQVDRRRRRKWVGVRFLYKVLGRPPYRYHSMDGALEAIPGAGYSVSQAAFVGRMMAGFKFDRRLGMDAHLRSLYGCFEGADIGVDYRDILCCMTILRRYKQVREDPSQLFRDLVLMYANKARTVMQRKDVLRVCRMGAVHEGEVWQTSSRLDRYLTEAARPRGLKPTFRDVTMTMLIEVMGSNPSVLAAFKTQLWQRLPEAWRMGALAAAETFGMNKAGSSAMAMQQRRAARWYANVLSRKVVIGWKIFRNNAIITKAQRAAVEKILRRRAVRTWHAHAADTANRRKWYTKAIERGRIVVLKRYFKRITDFVQAHKRLTAITWAFSKEGKLIDAGVGLLRGVVRKRSMRLALHVWCEAASLLNAWEFAVNRWGARLLRRAFIAFRDLVKAAVREYQLAEEADRRAAKIAEALEQAEREKVILAEAAELAAKLQKAQAKVALMGERAAAHKARLEAARAESIVRDRHVAGKQREARQRRIYEDRLRIHREFEAEWEVKFKELVKADMEAAKTWLESGEKEATFKVQKELETLKRKFYASPSPETMELERAISDPANAIFAHMAHRLYEKNMSLHQFFTQFDKEGDGYLTHEEFKGMVASLNIKLSGEKIRSVIRAIDLDGGGYIDFPEFEAAVRRHEEVCGAAGSAWKMYVSPVHAVMTLHNVETNEEIRDYKATAKDLLRTAKDNIIGMEGSASKKRLTEQREAAWDSLQKHRAAAVIQRQYHARAARKKRALLRWKWDVEVARLKAKATHNAATTIQCWWRVMRSKWLALRLLQITVEVLFDPGSNQKYYYNHGLGSATWSIPSMLRRWRGPAARMPDVLEWVLISRMYGVGYFYNTRSGLQQDQKPAGYIRCSSCETQLASRRCTMEERDLCFVCYRTEHLEGDESCWHEWKPSKAHTCKICGQRDATVACADCDPNAEKTGLVMCDNCWERSHANAKYVHREPLTIEQWSSNRAGCLGGGGTRAMGREVVSTALAGGILEDRGFGGMIIAAKSTAPAVDGHWWEGVDDVFAESVALYTGAEQFGHDPF